MWTLEHYTSIKAELSDTYTLMWRLLQWFAPNRVLGGSGVQLWWGMISSGSQSMVHYFPFQPSELSILMRCPDTFHVSDDFFFSFYADKLSFPKLHQVFLCLNVNRPWPKTWHYLTLKTITWDSIRLQYVMAFRYIKCQNFHLGEWIADDKHTLLLSIWKHPVIKMTGRIEGLRTPFIQT